MDGPKKNEEAGISHALKEIANLLNEQEESEEAKEPKDAKGSAPGIPGALKELAELLKKPDGSEGAEDSQEAKGNASPGIPGALKEIAELLKKPDGSEGAKEAQEAKGNASAGIPGALKELAELLKKPDGSKGAKELKGAKGKASAGITEALKHLAKLLPETQEPKEKEAAEPPEDPKEASKHLHEPRKTEAVGITEKLKEIAKLSLDRLPVLNTIFENMAAACVECFRDYCSPAFTAFVNRVGSGGSWDLLEASADSVAVVFYCREWDARILIGLERRLICAIIEAMFGGDGSEHPFDARRPFTPLETRIGRVVCEFAAEALETAFGAVCEISLAPERTETGLEFTTLGQNSMIMIEAKILFQVLDQGGAMAVLIPLSSMNPIRQKLERERKPLPSSFDPRWTSALTSRVSKAEVILNAVIEGKDIELDDLLRLEVGNTIELGGTDKNIILEYEGDRLFRGRLGQSQSHFTITVDAPLNEDSYLEGLDGSQAES